jgi:hypothetical protein
MRPSDEDEAQVPTLRELYPELTEDELKIAEEQLDLYLEECLETFDEIRADPERRALLEALTAEMTKIRMGNASQPYP